MKIIFFEHWNFMILTDQPKETKRGGDKLQNYKRQNQKLQASKSQWSNVVPIWFAGDMV